MSTLTYTDTLTIIDCGECHCPFAIPDNLYRRLVQRGDWFWCPNGCKIHYFNDENSALKKEKAVLERKLNNALSREQEQQQRAARAERTGVALRGHLTRYRKRVANGVCPVAGCHRHFPNVQSHVETVHGEWLAEHPEVFE